MEPLTWLVLIGAVAVLVGFIFLRKQSQRKGKWGIGSFGGTSCPRCGLPITRTRNLAHGQYRHSNVTVLVPASPGTILASRIEDSHEIHRTEPY